MPRVQQPTGRCRLVGGCAQEASAAACKPAEHQALFAGNCDDHFRLGIKLTRCTRLIHQ